MPTNNDEAFYMTAKLDQLKSILQEVYDLEATTALLNWDKATKMPAGGADARARQVALVSRLAHEKFTSDTVGHLLDDLQAYADDLPYDADDAGLIRSARILYDQRSRVPADFIATMEEQFVRSFVVWAKARPENDFATVAPMLERNLDISRQYAEYFAPYDHIADGLLGQSNYGISTVQVRALFAELRAELVKLLGAITDASPVDDAFLYGDFAIEKQYDFVKKAISAFGYDWQRGRMDDTHHPFATRFSIGDVRITTRADAHHLAQGIFATMHESGHAMYEQGIKRSYEPSVLARGTSSAVHESQSRLWENRVGRGKAFWQHFYADLQATFPQLESVSVDDFYKAINRVKPSLIRVEADEVTYNLHIMLRSDLSIDLLEGSLAVQDLPDAWRARYESDLGVMPEDDKDGVMQDVHWYAFHIGGTFEGYSLGNILGAQYYDALLAQHPTIEANYEKGDFSQLYGWLKDNIWQHGRKYTTRELTQQITGGDISVTPLVNYL
ncbi:MAG: carboxypeptidase M32, partial [Phototrophicaceae bacterium]